MIGTSELDLQLAIQLQEQFEEELKQQKVNVASSGCKQISKNVLSKSEAPLTVSLVDPVWELVDPVPDVHALFCTYNDQFFWGKLLSVSVSWSPRMTLCAGVCSYERRGGLCSIRLSVPLLKLRPRSDLVETLLHEMIHAYLFVTANNKDRDGHGPEFLKHMHRINAKARTKISVYHSFHDEVAMYQQHVWQCSGPCRQRRPYYGLVKRSMNRAPGPNDRWWSEHKRTCGGTYTKIKEPEGYGTKGVKRKAVLPVNGTEAKRKANTLPSQDISSFFTGSGKSASGTASNISKPPFGASSNNNSAGTNVSRAIVDKQSSVSTVSKRNIRGFESTASGAVKSVEVGNASRSKIVGFNKGLNKNTSNSANKNEGRGSSSWRSGSGGGLALGSGGTLVLNPKTNSKTATAETKNVIPSSKDEEGHVLGGDAAGSRSQAAVRSSGESGSKPQRPVSRLLAEYDATMASRNTKKQQNTSSIIQRNVNRSIPPSTVASSSSQSTDVSNGAHQLKLTHPSASDSVLPKTANRLNSFIDSDESDEDDVSGVKICPLCERSIHVNEFLSHISVCMGNWGEDVGLEMEDLPLLSTLKDLDDSNNACVPVRSSNDSEGSRMMTDETTPRDVAGGSFLSRGTQSDFLGSPKKMKHDSNASSGVLLKNEHGDKVRMKKMENDEVLVSDSDEEFDEKYWKKPILSVVQLAQGINKLGVDEGRERGACSLESGVASSGSREHFERNDDSANAPPTFPCPVCGELYTEEYITSVHMNTHFD